MSWGLGFGPAEPTQAHSEESGSEPMGTLELLVRAALMEWICSPQPGVVEYPLPLTWTQGGGLLVGRGCAGLASEEMPVPTASCTFQTGPRGPPQLCVLKLIANIY